MKHILLPFLCNEKILKIGITEGSFKLFLYFSKAVAVPFRCRFILRAAVAHPSFFFFFIHHPTKSRSRSGTDSIEEPSCCTGTPLTVTILTSAKQSGSSDDQSVAVPPGLPPQRLGSSASCCCSARGAAVSLCNRQFRSRNHWRWPCLWHAAGEISRLNPLPCVPRTKAVVKTAET